MLTQFLGNDDASLDEKHAEVTIVFSPEHRKCVIVAWGARDHECFEPALGRVF